MFNTLVMMGMSLPATSGFEMWPTPIRADLAPIAHRIIHEDCRLLIIGDSNSLRESSPRMLGSMMRTWKPDAWSGRVSPGIPSIDNGVKLTTSEEGFNIDLRRVWNAATDDPEVWSNGQDGFIPTRGMDLRTTGEGVSGEAVYLSASLTKLSEYNGGDWTLDAPLHARLVFAASPDGMDSMRYAAMRGETAGEYSNFSLRDDQAKRPLIDWVEVDVPAGEGAIRSEVRSPEGWLSAAEGGPFPCPDNCVLDEKFFHVTQVFWRSDRPGLQIDALAEAGFAAWDHLESSGHYDDMALRGYLEATRHPNVFMVLLGQNMREGEWHDINGVWRSHVEEILDRYRSASLANDPDADPMFLLVAPWQTQTSFDRFFEMAHVLHDIALTRSDTGFVNLMGMAGSYAHNRAETLESSGVHFGSDEGADYFTSLIWAQLERELTGKADHALPGSTESLSSIDMSESDASVWILPGSWMAGVEIDGTNVSLHGWDRDLVTLLSESDGNAVHVRPGASCDISRLSIQGGSGIQGADGIRRGGAVLADSSMVSITECHLQEGSADLGGLLAQINAETTMIDTRLKIGLAIDGGLIHVNGGSLTAADCFLSGGIAMKGGGVLVQDGVVIINDSHLFDSEALLNGGAAAVFGGELTWNDVEVDGCVSESGGALTVVAGETVLLGCNVHGNTAVTGGGLINEGGALSVATSQFCSNPNGNIIGEWVDMGGNILEDICVCPADLDVSGSVDVQDLLLVIEGWGPCPSDCPADLSGDGLVGTDDLLAVIAEWGICN